MVPIGIDLMKKIRDGVPFFAFAALIVLFLKMPEVSKILDIFKCELCGKNQPYLPLIGAGYFTGLFALSMLFPKFPNPLIARGGLIWALLLAVVLTYIDLPNLCIPCLIGHFCNILIWMIWLLVPPSRDEYSHSSPIRERLFLTLLSPLCIIALFACLNLTFMIYNYKSKQVETSSLKTGHQVPSFKIRGDKENFFADTDIPHTQGTFINFVSPNCPYCQKQLSLLNETSLELANSSLRFINISPILTADLVKQAPSTEWYEDKEGHLRERFKVTGYPTLFLVGKDGKIIDVISGVSKELKTSLLNHL